MHQGVGLGDWSLGSGLSCPLIFLVAIGLPLFSKPQFPFSNHQPAGQTPAWLISDSRMGHVGAAAAVEGGDMAREESGLPNVDAGARTHVS